jgi:hypothetical protein
MKEARVNNSLHNTVHVFAIRHSGTDSGRERFGYLITSSS